MCYGISEYIYYSDGGVSESIFITNSLCHRVYLLFRWCGIGIVTEQEAASHESISVIPIVGYRNQCGWLTGSLSEYIYYSDGGVFNPHVRAKWPVLIIYIWASRFAVSDYFLLIFKKEYQYAG